MLLLSTIFNCYQKYLLFKLYDCIFEFSLYKILEWVPVLQSYKFHNRKKVLFNLFGFPDLPLCFKSFSFSWEKEVLRAGAIFMVAQSSLLAEMLQILRRMDLNNCMSFC